MNHPKILIVEDDVSICELIRITLLSPLHVITCVDNGNDALTELARLKPDLVVLDILIPEPDGWEVYKVIRSNPELIHTRIIILTALLFMPQVYKEMNVLPADLIMKKPFELDELRSNVNNMLSFG
jgi:DNA-binding response OmpR family regulator